MGGMPVSVLTEAAIRVLLKDADLEAMKEFSVESGVIVTPSARAWLLDNKIDLIIGDKRVLKAPAPPQAKPCDPPESALPSPEKPLRYRILGGGFCDEKPEHLTALRGTTLVPKDHRIIKLRGRFDSLEAKILETQLAFRRLGIEKGIADLADTLAFVRELLRCEVLDQPLGPMLLFGMDEAEIRSRSHAPKKFYGIPHFFASVDDGEAVVLLNSLRTAVRETEIAAYEAFKTEGGEPLREDIGRALNRLSSAFYVMMFRAKTKEYDHERE